MSAGRSGRDVGDENHARLREWLTGGPAIPRRPNGDVDVPAVADLAGLTSRQAIYKTARNRELLDEHLRRSGIPPIGTRTSAAHAPAAPADDERRALRRRVDQLERELASARAETAELRRRMRRLEAVDAHLADTGRLVR